MKLGSRMVKFFSFGQDRDSVLNTEDGRKKLRDVGIGTPSEVGDWRTSLINRTHSYIHRFYSTLDFAFTYSRSRSISRLPLSFFPCKRL